MKSTVPHLQVAQGLRIETAIGVVVLGCGFGGLLLATVLSMAWSWVDQRSTELSREASPVYDLRRLDDELAEYATKVDLVLSGGQTWFMADLERSTARMRTLLDRMEWDEIQEIQGDFNTYLDVELARLDKMAADFSEDHDVQLAQAVSASDAEFEILLKQFHQADEDIQKMLAVQRVELNKSRSILSIVTWVAVGLYLIFVAMLWRWAAATITRPIERLARATLDSLETGVPLAVTSSGPREVRTLTQSVLSLTGSLEAIVHDRTSDIERMAEFRRVILDTVPFPLAHIDVHGKFQQCNPAYLAFFGESTSSDLIGRPIDELPIGSLLEFGDNEHNVMDGDGNHRTVHLISADVPGNMGQILCLMDVTERVEHTERLRLLHRELDHRVKNMLAIIVALCSQAAEHASTDLELLRDLTNRVMGFSNIHELLSKEGATRLDFQKMIHTCVAPFLPEGSRKLELSGSPVKVKPSAAVKLVMVFNELITNASKHGALKHEDGRIQISWVEVNGQLELTWQEHHGGEVPEKLEGGFGTMILRTSIPYEFDGLVSLDRTEDGIIFKASISLDKVMDS